MRELDELLREHSDRVPIDDVVERQALDRTRHALRAATVAAPPAAARRRRGRQTVRLALVGGLAATVVVVVASLPGGLRERSESIRAGAGIREDCA